jgi:hypothetical protein
MTLTDVAPFIGMIAIAVSRGNMINSERFIGSFVLALRVLKFVSFYMHAPRGGPFCSCYNFLSTNMLLLQAYFHRYKNTITNTTIPPKKYNA